MKEALIVECERDWERIEEEDENQSFDGFTEEGPGTHRLLDFHGMRSHGVLQGLALAALGLGHLGVSPGRVQTRWLINSLAPGRSEWNFRHVIFKQILVIDGWGISCEITLRWMLLGLADKSTLVQVMAWCCQATSHYLSQCWPRFCFFYKFYLAHSDKRYNFIHSAHFHIYSNNIIHIYQHQHLHLWLPTCYTFLYLCIVKHGSHSQLSLSVPYLCVVYQPVLEYSGDCWHHMTSLGHNELTPCGLEMPFCVTDWENTGLGNGL